jgi:small GTP-binding protein
MRPTTSSQHLQAPLPASLQLTPPLPGKSSLTVQFVDNHFVESYYPTIENTFSKVIRYRNQDYATEIIDTAGQVCRDSITACRRMRQCCVVGL